jgi:hypothetical protein
LSFSFGKKINQQPKYLQNQKRGKKKAKEQSISQTEPTPPQRKVRITNSSKKST